MFNIDQNVLCTSLTFLYG